jgi:hypothetical protein
MSMQMAKEAVARVWNTRFSNYIPPELRNRRAEDIFVFHQDETPFKDAFARAWVTVLKKANGAGCLAHKAVLDIAGFVTPIAEISQRKIHLSPTNFVKEQ